MAASSTISCSNYNPNSTQRKQNSPLERRPRTLKDFLHDDSNSCCSNGFKSFPRKSYQNSSISPENLNNSQRLQRCRSKAASTTISAFQAMINAIKSLSPRKPSKRNSQSQLNEENKGTEIKITVTVKDIIRWKSFRDLVEEKSLPSDLASSSPHHCTTAATTTTGSNTPCSNGSSWCDSDFTSEYLPSDEYGENDVGIVGKKSSPCVGKDPMNTATTTKTDMGPKHASEETDQKSPVSVLDFEHGIEMETKWDRNGELECEMVKLVKAWINGEHGETTTREACVREMEREGGWRNCRFDEEEEELAMGVERWVMNTLVDELLVDLR
ncbi:TON1 Recruiting Motif 9 [Hibiscus trionum]|uniref:TON1 Recruiting Motif 9 n=1 Tax=Hibiscus trionum TaxID=183268 RepID=A0A9W7LTA6_HIBTR|nr:TON1 Recruiting Motif 9 [Hibiscus trionum]